MSPLIRAHTRCRPILPRKYPHSKTTFCLGRDFNWSCSAASAPTSSGVQRTTANPTWAYSSNFSMIVRPSFGCSRRITGSNSKFSRNLATVSVVPSSLPLTTNTCLEFGVPAAMENTGVDGPELASTQYSSISSTMEPRIASAVSKPSRYACFALTAFSSGEPKDQTIGV